MKEYNTPKSEILLTFNDARSISSSPYAILHVI